MEHSIQSRPISVYLSEVPMDVFKTHVGEGKALMINEENFYLATRERNRMSSIVVA